MAIYLSIRIENHFPTEWWPKDYIANGGSPSHLRPIVCLISIQSTMSFKVIGQFSTGMCLCGLVIKAIRKSSIVFIVCGKMLGFAFMIVHSVDDGLLNDKKSDYSVLVWIWYRRYLQVTYVWNVQINCFDFLLYCILKLSVMIVSCS